MKKTTKRKSSISNPLPKELQSDRPADAGLLFAKGALGLSVILFVGSLIFALSSNSQAIRSTQGKVLGVKQINRVEEVKKEYEARLADLRNEYGTVLASALDAISGDKQLDEQIKKNFIDQLSKFRSELSELRVPSGAQEEYLKLVTDVDKLIGELK